MKFNQNIQVMRNLQYMLANIFNMNLVDMETEDGGQGLTICPYKNFTFVHKKYLNIFMWAFPLSLCSLWYVLYLDFLLWFFTMVSKFVNKLYHINSLDSELLVAPGVLSYGFKHTTPATPKHHLSTTLSHTSSICHMPFLQFNIEVVDKSS